MMLARASTENTEKLISFDICDKLATNSTQIVYSGVYCIFTAIEFLQQRDSLIVKMIYVVLSGLPLVRRNYDVAEGESIRAFMSVNLNSV